MTRSLPDPSASSLPVWTRALDAAPWAAVLALFVWTGYPHPAWLVAAAAAVVASVVRGRPSRSPATALGVALAAGALGIAFHAEGRDARLAADFPGYWADRESQVFATLESEVGGLLDRAEQAATTVAGQVAPGNPPPWEEVAELRSHTGLTALAVYDAAGELVVWDGVHRGKVPEAVQAGRERFGYGELPLVSYLYVTAPVEGGGTVVSAVLLRSDLPAGGSGAEGDFASRIRRATGERIRISTADRAGRGEIFDLSWEGGVLFSVSLDRPGEAARRAQLMDRARLRAVGLVLLLWLVWAVAAPAGPGRGRAAALTLVAGSAVLPAGLLPGLGGLASPADFLLPLPVPVTLTRLAAMTAAGAVAAGVARPWRWPAGRPLVGVLLVGMGFPLLALALAAGPSTGFLAGREDGWTTFTLVGGGLATMLAWVALTLSRREGPRRLRTGLGLLVLAALTLVAALAASRLPGVPVAVLALWAVPLVVMRPAGPRREGVAAATAWLLAGVMGVSATLPFAWGERTRARMVEVEQQVARLGTEADPYLEFLLERTAVSVDSLDAEGASPVELLYRGWRLGGLAEAGYPVWFTLWSAPEPAGEGTDGQGLPQEELRVGLPTQARPAVADGWVQPARQADTVQIHRFETADAHYLMALPLDDGRVVTAVVPPLRGTGGASLLGPLFGSLGAEMGDPLTLIPIQEGEDTRYTDSLSWRRTADGWQGELALAYPDLSYHAHYEVDLVGPLVAAARGTLLLTLALALLGVAWGVGRLVSERSGRWFRAEWFAPRSFRARVTVALFGFFLLSNLIFGSLAYRTIAGASERTARVLSERAVNDGAAAYLDVQGRMSLLARRVGADLLEYRRGELREGSVEELVELGLYEGWVPYSAAAALSGRESLLEETTTSLGDWEYVTAYRRLPDGDVLGAPVPMEAGAAAVRSREVAHLVGFAVLLGAGLSLVLALLVGRALARPIQTLRVASERVGSGNLGVRLPGARHDEFGAVFEAFNRMVRRLRRARRDLVRTTRRTQAIVEDAATGVLAFDAEGVVTLANSRARDLLGLDLRVGERLPRARGAAEEFVRWMGLYFRDGLREAATEIQSGERRIRVRVRRISRTGPLAGAVASLEDVTDELRTERILAWGEMARQVAHEVKNPLTPIKLSVQHIRRAFDDGRPDFEAILTRNADAMLREIDRLAAIASSFSRFGAPGSGAPEPLRAVRLQEVVPDVMALYATGEGPIRFEWDVPDETPAVAAREDEVKEVLVNLLENARAAIRDQGSVRVEAVDDDTEVVLRVVDDGSGIPAEMIPRIFEPHFSTRSAGTGLGLAIVQRLVDAWGASVAVESVEGEGTTLTLRFARAGEGQGPAGGGTEGADPSP